MGGPGVFPGARIEPLGFIGAAAARRRDLALLQERIGDRNRLIEQSAWIVAQVDDEALDAGLGCDQRYGPALIALASNARPRSAATTSATRRRDVIWLNSVRALQR